ncbi:MAG: ABC-ATPase domain-containing protein, partial [Desulfobacterales bacterium]|nr:ABC-ATPase domain-containing protein [Desulfobacterales bacterium]
MEKLKEKLLKIDGKGYKAYKDLQGVYHSKEFLLHIDYVQPDPFANPSRVRVVIQDYIANFPREWYQTKTRKIAFEDFLAREICKKINLHKMNRKSSGKSGLIFL